jgi:hypothetical protein
VSDASCSRAFSPGGARRRVVLATPDARAQALYLGSGVYPRSPYMFFSRAPEPVHADTDLTFEQVGGTPETLAACADIDREVLDVRRDGLHGFLLEHQQLYLYCRGTRAVGYGYVGEETGPIALLSASDFPAALAHAERLAAERGQAKHQVIVPLVNSAAVSYLLARKYRFGVGHFFCMSDVAFGKLDQYVLSGMMAFL